MKLYEALEELPPNVADAFVKLGEEQRGIPETAMLNLQSYLGGGVLSVVAEHDGDLIHRMTHMANFNHFLRGTVKEKIDKTLHLFENPYGFDREYKENLAANAKYFKIPLNTYTKQVNSLLVNYHTAFTKLIPFNQIQWYAIRVPLFIGIKDWAGATTALRVLQKWTNDADIYETMVREYTLDSDGNLLPYPRYYSRI